MLGETAKLLKTRIKRQNSSPISSIQGIPTTGETSFATIVMPGQAPLPRLADATISSEGRNPSRFRYNSTYELKFEFA